MSETALISHDDAVHALHAAIEEAAGLLEVTYPREQVLRVLDLYGGDLAQAVVAFRVSTGADRAGELDCRFTVPNTDAGHSDAAGDDATADPYELALAHGLLEPTDHPVSRLLADLRAHLPIDGYGIDFGVVGGFKKIWVILPRTALQRVADLARIPTMPPALGESLDYVARHGLGDTVGLLGIDYRHRTVNIYFGEPPEGGVPAETLRAMLREIGQPEPGPELLGLAGRLFGIYLTLTWDSPVIARVSFAVATTDPASLPVALDDRIDLFVRHIRRSDPHTRFVYAVATQPDGAYYKLQAYYRWGAGVPEIMQLPVGALADPV